MFKINVSDKGKTYKVESESESFIGLKIGEKVNGSLVLPELSDYELEIAGASDKAGFPAFKEIEGTGLKKVLLKKGWGMKKSRPKGLRLKKSVRGNTISQDIVQINLKVIKEGKKKLGEIFKKEEAKPEEKKTEAKTEAKAEQKTEKKPEKTEEKKDETKINS